MAVDHNNPQSRDEEILIATIDGKEYDKIPQSRIEELLLELKQVIEDGGGGGGTTNYNNLSNKPQVNGITLSGDKSASDLSLVLAEVGKGLSTNDYSDEEKAKVANLLTAIEGILTGSDIDSFGDVETALSAIKDGTEIDSFGDVEVALLDKVDTSDLGTAAAKDSTNAVTAGSTDLVESGAVKDAIDAAVAAAYHHAGTKTVAQLTHDLLIASNEGNVYNITDSGTTTSDFIEGIGKQIDAGDNVGICKVGDVYMFDLLSGLEDTSIFVQKSQTAGLLNNDGTVNTTIEGTVAGHTAAIATKQPITDNTLQTADKTIPGAINELKSGLTNLKYAKITNVFTLTDGSQNLVIHFSGNAYKRMPHFLLFRCGQTSIGEIVQIGFSGVGGALEPINGLTTSDLTNSSVSVSGSDLIVDCAIGGGWGYASLIDILNDSNENIEITATRVNK